MSVRDKIVLLSALIVIVGGALIINGRFNAANALLQSDGKPAMSRPNTFPKQLNIKDTVAMTDTRGAEGMIKSFAEPVTVDIKPEPVAQTPVAVAQNVPAQTAAAQNIAGEAAMAVRYTTQAPQVLSAPPAAKAVTGDTYTVQKGQTLTDVAIAVYKDKTNAIANAHKIYEFNKDQMASIHQLKIGQKLRLPAIEKAKQPDTKAKQLADSTQVKGPQTVQETVEAVQDKPQDKVQVQLMSSKFVAAPKEKLYVVKKGDNLWGIAQNVLGSGSRYKEIVDANKGHLTGKEKLSPGMAIVIPN